MIKFEKIDYRQLNARQKENFNFQKVSAVLADFGFVTLRLSDDWEGADFIAQHISGRVIRVQLKSRLAFYEKYRGKDLYVAFGENGSWYLYPHDEVLAKVIQKIGTTSSWKEDGGYSFPQVPQDLKSLIEPYRIGGGTEPLPK
jgi:hypothetical protein